MDSGQLEDFLGRIRSKDDLTYQHCGKSAEYALRLGEVLNLPPEELARLKTAAMLHDLGKIRVPDEILLKPAALTEEEFSLIRCHPAWGAEMVEEEDDSHYREVADIIRHHHERYDGMGYPQGLASADIPYLAQIVAIADAYDAMTSDRPYRAALPFNRVQEILVEERGRQFQPELVDRFLEIICA
ncbi:HD-GYP domain-containing protein [Paradesulfitobacterium ferrireducens]|uniref:HD-GYP domain-containing protein n=1 Tax=Paradesulfitobacterium ferrireducens TaxID=2816476 RepID=UPI001A8F0F27|nr:HD-GYP domain-containing protein [Paradesulfitobacterium ferrireducens]